MHRVGISQGIIDRVLARRGRLHIFERLDPMIQQFGDVLTADEALAVLENK